VAEVTGAADAGGAPVASGARWSPAGRPAVFFALSSTGSGLPQAASKMLTIRGETAFTAVQPA
jgi:hypothetical protein